MSKLLIKLSGEIEDSNFDEWKEDLLTKIKSVNTDLTKDSEFADAAKHVKSFKAAELALKKAKASAIKQAADINSLFEAIDEVKAETREVRLTLERQIKKRKAEIKEEFVEKGVARAAALIESQSEDFKLIDTARFTDSDQFIDVAKGKASSKGLQKAIDTACAGIEEQINAKAADVKKNAAAIDSLAAGYKILFQDRATLLDMPKAKLDTLIDERISQYNEEQERAKSSAGDSTAENVESSAQKEQDSSEESEKDSEKAAAASDANATDFELVISLHASEDRAGELLEKLKDDYMAKSEVTDIVLRGV